MDRNEIAKRNGASTRAIANFLLELQGNAEDAMALVEEGDFDSEFVAMLEQDINEIAEELYNVVDQMQPCSGYVAMDLEGSPCLYCKASPDSHWPTLVIISWPDDGSSDAEFLTEWTEVK